MLPGLVPVQARGEALLQPTLLRGRRGARSTTSLMISAQSCPAAHSASAFLTSSISAALQIPLTRTKRGRLVHALPDGESSRVLSPAGQCQWDERGESLVCVTGA